MKNLTLQRKVATQSRYRIISSNNICQLNAEIGNFYTKYTFCTCLHSAHAVIKDRPERWQTFNLSTSTQHEYVAFNNLVPTYTE